MLSISASLGVIRILSAAFVDYGNISEKHQCKEHFATHHIRDDKSEGITIIKTVGVEEVKALEHSQSFRKFDQIRCSTR